MVTFVILKFHFGGKVNRKDVSKKKHEESLRSYHKCQMRNDGGSKLRRMA